MPVQVTYPGIYIEEIPSGNHSIVGSPTAITTFIGRSPKGPVDEAHTVSSFGDFEKFFGNLTFDYPLTYAIRDFFTNGGSEAIIIRRFISKSVTAPVKNKTPAKKTTNDKAPTGSKKGAGQ